MTQQLTDEKQYFVLQDVSLSGFHSLKKDEVVWLKEDVAYPLVSSNFITPLLNAIRQKLYPPVEETLTEKVEDVVDVVLGKPKQKRVALAETSPAIPVEKSPTPVKKTPQDSEIVSALKSATQKRTTKKAAIFENELRKKILAKKAAANGKGNTNS